MREKQTLQKNSVVFTGESGAGKSTLAEMYAERNAMPFFAAGGFERDYAKSFGYEDILAFERDFGLDKAYYSLVPSMLLRIKELARQEGIIVDGVYDPILFEKITHTLAHRPAIVKVTAPLELRILRKALQYKMTVESAREHILQLDASKEITGRKELMRMADLAILNDKDLEGAYSSLEGGLKKLLRSD